VIKNHVINGGDHYSVDYRPQSDGTIKLFAVDYPHDPWGKSVRENHLYPSSQICVSPGREPHSMERAKAIAMVWCEGWSKYIRTGQFPRGSKQVKV